MTQIESAIRRDPARRGLLGADPQQCSFCLGHLQGAARELADSAKHAGIVTGFFVPRAETPAAETDGPPGAAMLADVLLGLGVRATIVTDEHCCSAVRAAAHDIACDHIVCSHADEGWIKEFFESGAGRTMTHLVSIERVGPSHCADSLDRQVRECDVPRDRFLELVAAESHGRCHNMRGDHIDAYSADLHRLFDVATERRADLRSIGIGDGGNEIGMGAILWEDLADRLCGDHGPRVPCRIATDWTILAGTSNWGAFALAALVAALRHRAELIAPWDEARHLDLLQRMVADGPAVDGITGRPEPTVDGLPFATYMQPWDSIRRLLGVTG